MKTPFIKYVPTEVCANLRWRAKIHKRVVDDPSFASVIWDACAVDPLFYISGFGYTYDTRQKPFTRLPFILYPFQQEGLLEILKAIGNYDLLIEKSRDMGASWLCILAFEWDWHFAEELSAPSYLMGSRVEEYVDKADNPKALFWKLDYFHQHLPLWLMPPGYNRAEHRRDKHIKNPCNGAVIDGESTTKNFARGDRRKAIMLDEFAAVEQGSSVLPATRDATRSRIFNSTPLGPNNAYYDVAQTNIAKLRFFWTEHPSKSLGLYTASDGGELKVLRKDGYPEDYKPILDGAIRSPAYDIEEGRSSPREMAREWNIDYEGSGNPFFLAGAVQESIRKFARPSMLVGDLEYDSTTAEPIGFRKNPEGCLRLWFLLDKDGNPPRDHKKVLGNDVAAGTGASNSVGCGYDAVTNEKLLEYVNPYIRPEEFAKQMVAIAKWMNYEIESIDTYGKRKRTLIGAYLIWESNGPGRQFGSRIMDLRYGNIYFRKREETISKKVSQIPGWAATKETKLTLLGDYRAAVEKGMCINRSREALEECLEYIFDPQGSVSHFREDNKEDPSGAKANHGDRVTADALAWRGMTERKSKLKPIKPEVPYGSLAWRTEQREAAKLKPNRELHRSDGW